MPFIDQMKEKGRELAPEDIEPEISGTARRMINKYFHLTRWRPEGMSGPGQIGLDVIESYCRYYGAVLSSWELDMIRTMDDQMISLWHKARPSK